MSSNGCSLKICTALEVSSKRIGISLCAKRLVIRLRIFRSFEWCHRKSCSFWRSAAKQLWSYVPRNQSCTAFSKDHFRFTNSLTLEQVPENFFRLPDICMIVQHTAKRKSFIRNAHWLGTRVISSSLKIAISQFWTISATHRAWVICEHYLWYEISQNASYSLE
jgi:hypothetical protein